MCRTGAGVPIGLDVMMGAIRSGGSRVVASPSVVLVFEEDRLILGFDFGLGPLAGFGPSDDDQDRRVVQSQVGGAVDDEVGGRVGVVDSLVTVTVELATELG